MVTKQINQKYQEESTLLQAKESFEAQSPRQFIQIPDILIPKQRAILLQDITSEDKNNRWENINQPHVASYEYKSITSEKTKEIISSVEVTDLIEKIIGKSIEASKIQKEEIQTFKHKDFTILHDDFIKNFSNNQSQRYLIIFDLTRNWPFEARGELVITKANNDAKNIAPLIIRPSQNTLTIIKLEADDIMFTKYVNASAKQKQIIRIIKEIEF